MSSPFFKVDLSLGKRFHNGKYSRNFFLKALVIACVNVRIIATALGTKTIHNPAINMKFENVVRTFSHGIQEPL
jgi:hypothetical protein